MGAVLPTVVLHDFVIKDDVITIELSHTEMATGDAGDLALYNRLLDLMWSIAAEGDDARALLLSAVTAVRAAGGATAQDAGERGKARQHPRGLKVQIPAPAVLVRQHVTVTGGHQSS